MSDQIARRQEYKSCAMRREGLTRQPHTRDFASSVIVGALIVRIRVLGPIILIIILRNPQNRLL